jgi:hypothetical protein
MRDTTNVHDLTIWNPHTHINNTYIIFASDKSDDETHKFLEDMAIGYKQLRGSYTSINTGEVIEETSFIINEKHWPYIEASEFIANQETVLHLAEPLAHKQGRRPASLIALHDGSSIELGLLTPVSKEVAVTKQDWTYDPALATYFITEEQEEKETQEQKGKKKPCQCHC